MRKCCPEAKLTPNDLKLKYNDKFEFEGVFYIPSKTNIEMLKYRSSLKILDEHIEELIGIHEEEYAREIRAL